MALWTVHLEGGPRRVNHAAVAIGKLIFSFGGYCTGEDFTVTKPMDIHVLNTVSYRWTALPVLDPTSPQCSDVPYQRYGHTAITYDDLVYIWGGRNDCDGASNVLHCFHSGTCKWSRPAVRGDNPGARDGHSACLVNNYMYIFGGYEERVDMFSNQIHALNLDTMEWFLLKVTGKSPRWRDFHTACGIGNQIYVFGGRMDHSGPYHTGNEFYCNKLQVFNTVARSWHEPQTTGDIPYGRRSHSAWIHKGCMYIFGGYNGLHDLHFGDTYHFNPATEKWTLVTTRGESPSCRRRQSCCLVEERVFLFGGTSPCTSCDHSPMEFNLLDHSDLHVLDFEKRSSTSFPVAFTHLLGVGIQHTVSLAPTLKTLCSLTVLKHHLPTHDLPPDIRWELTAMTTNGNISRPLNSSG